MMESAIIQERRCLLQQQRDITLPAEAEIIQRSEITCDEGVDDNFLDMGESHADSVSGLSFALEGAQGFSRTYPYSGSTAVGGHLYLSTLSDLDTCKTILSDNSVVVPTHLRSRSGTSKLRDKLRDIKAAHRQHQSRTVLYEPPALFQGLVAYI